PVHLPVRLRGPGERGGRLDPLLPAEHRTVRPLRLPGQPLRGHGAERPAALPGRADPPDDRRARLPDALGRAWRRPARDAGARRPLLALVILHGRVLTDGRELPPSRVVVEDDRIVAVEVGRAAAADLEAGDGWIAPGLIDLQVNG